MFTWPKKGLRAYLTSQKVKFVTIPKSYNDFFYTDLCMVRAHNKRLVSLHVSKAGRRGRGTLVLS